MPDVDDLTQDHAALSDGFAARRYFAKFNRITGHLARVAAEMHKDGSLDRREAAILSGYVAALSRTFDALSLKYLLTGRDTGRFFGSLSFDAHESGFPVFRELLTMANDATQAGEHLRSMASVEDLKDRMVRQIIGDLEIPTRAQFALSQRLYYEALLGGDLFWARNDPQLMWLGETDTDRRNPRRRFLLHWASYDSQINLPTVYVMELDDTGRRALSNDDDRWPEVQSHLMAQSVAGLKLLTIATGFDRDFDDLHPKRLRRFHIGPMYSSAFTTQSGPLHQVLEQARAPQGEDWALAWTVEDLVSERVQEERKGFFGSVEREVFALDPFSGRAAETGATRTERAVIMPQRPYQALADLNPPGFRDVTKFVVSGENRVLRYR